MSLRDILPKILKQGVGAVCSVAIKFLHPQRRIKEVFPNTTLLQRLEHAIVLRQEKKNVNRKDIVCIVLRHELFEGNEIYALQRYVRVETEGDERGFADDPVIDEPIVEGEGPNDVPDPVEEFEASVFHAGNNADDIANVRAMGLGMDDDNEPAPENIPQADDMPLPNDQTWGWDGIDTRKARNLTNVKARMKHYTPDNLGEARLHGIFFVFFPVDYVKDVLVLETSENIFDRGLKPTNTREIIWFIGLWFFMATLGGFKVEDYWSKKEICIEEGVPYRLNKFMTRNIFRDLNACLALTSEQPPTFKDPFWKVRQLMAAWKLNMQEEFIPSWVSCLDESISIWFNRWTCPRWMFVPRKPHPFGNKYHTITDGCSGITFDAEIVEGKDHPKEMPKDPLDKEGKTVGLLLRLCSNLYSSGKVVILDSGFCVLKGIICLAQKGVYSAAVIKKRQYWPKYVPGDQIDDHMENKDVGGYDSLKGILDGVDYNIFCMKEEDYTMQLMSTYGGLVEPERERMNTRRTLKDGSKK